MTDALGNEPTEGPPKQNIDYGRTEEFNEDQRKLIKQLVETMGVTELSDRTTRLETTMETVIQRLDQVITSNNSVIEHLKVNGSSTTAISPTNQSMNQTDKIEAIGKLITSLDPLIQRYLVPTPAPAGILDQAYINEKIAKSAMGSFEIGEALTDVIKQKITGKAVQNIVKDIVSHEPA